MQDYMINLCVLIFIFGSVNAQWTSSDPQSNGKTYHWSSEKKTWNQSKLECQSNGWRLATVLTAEDHDNLQTFVKSQGFTTWIGLYLTTFSIPEGVWTDGSPLTFNRSSGYWAPDEPQSDQPCVTIWDERNFDWDDVYCSTPYNFVCETQDVMDPTNFQTVGENILSYGNQQSNEENLLSASNALDQLLMADPQEFEQSKNLSRDILATFDEFVGRYQGEDFGEEKENVNIAVRKAENHTMIFGNDTSTKSQIVMNLTSQLLDELRLKTENISSSIQVGSILYKSGDLFQTNETRYEVNFRDSGNHSHDVETLQVPIFGENPQIRLKPQLTSDIISAQISELNESQSISKVDTSTLVNAVRISAEVCENSSPPSFPLMKADTHFSCVFWDAKSNGWSDRGCRMVKLESSGSSCSDTNSSSGGRRITCECAHMTHFAIILDTTYINAPKYLDYLTIAGCSISAFFHLAAVVTILCFRHMRSETHKRIICNISANLLAMNLTFLIGIDRTEDFAYCNATSFILHFFILTSWCWMLCEAIYLPSVLFLRKFRGETRFLLVGGILAYALPAVGAAATFFASGSGYLSRRNCWLSSGIQTYAVYIPIGCILGINVISLAAAIYAMTCGFKMKSSVATDVRQTIRRIVYMIFLLGLPWIFGFLMLLSQYPTVKEIFSVLFAVSNLLQGVIIFVAFCGTDDKFRKRARRIFSVIFEPMHPLSRTKSFTVQNEQHAPSTDELRDTTMTTNGSSTLATPQNKKRLPFRTGWH